MTITLAQAKTEIERLTDRIPVELQALICHTKGHDFQPHGRLGYAIRRAGSNHWESRPTFDDFDRMRRYLLDEHTRVVMLQQVRQGVATPNRWKCHLQREYGGRLDEGAGFGRDPAAALVVAWLALEIERSGKPK